MDRVVSYEGTYLENNNNPLGLEVYRPAPELVEAVNLALILKQPLLLMGEPGCGKTRLAEAVAAELHQFAYKEHYFRWDVKSTSKAKDGIYYYDALARMYDAGAHDSKAKDVKNYISYGKFANALTKAQNAIDPGKNVPNILLIDEIDKADIDFPNDLLMEIEKREFTIPETGEKIEAASQALIIITSNRERELPPAFLRRCLYYFIGFPQKDDLAAILSAKFGMANDTWIANAVNLFLDIRAKMDSQFSESEKKPSTSELIEWFKIIHYYRQKGAAVSESVKSQLAAIENYRTSTGIPSNIPFPQVLLKTWEANKLFGVNN